MKDFSDAPSLREPSSLGLIETLQAVRNHFSHYLANLEHKQTGRDPKCNSFAYATVPDWSMRQQVDRLDAALKTIDATGVGVPARCNWCGELVTGPCDYPDDPCGLYGEPLSTASESNRKDGSSPQNNLSPTLEKGKE